MSSELLVRLSANPNLKAVLDALPPKMLTLSSVEPPKPVELKADTLGTRVNHVVARIKEAKFTGKGDAETVPGLYKSYIERVATVLTSTLALQSALDSQVETLPTPSPLP